MPKTSLSFRMQGVSGFNNYIERVNEGMDDFKEPLDESGVHMHKSIAQNFMSGGRPKQWPPLSPLTKRLRGSNAKPLRDTGQLFNSVTHKTGKGSVYKLSKNKLVIGSNVTAKNSSRLLADIQQNGSPIKVFGKTPSSIPPRPFLMFQDQDEEIIGKIFNEYIEGLLEE